MNTEATDKAAENASAINAATINTTALAYIGDGVYEIFVRKMMVSRGWAAADHLHRETVKYVRAESQAYAVKKINDMLTPEEQDLIRRARNRKSVTKPKNADPISYKLATALEALIGYLFLTDKNERIDEIMKRVVDEIDRKA
jgi:ribonuclease III family protein